MSSRRGWIVASAFLLLGALAGAGAVRQHWLSCRGSILTDSIIYGYEDGSGFSDACLQAMDDGFSLVWPDGKDPWRAESVLGVSCALLLALAWATVVLASTWSRPTKLLSWPPAILTATAGLVTLSGASSETLDSWFSRLLVAVNVSAVIAFVAIVWREKPGRCTTWKVGAALVASTAVGFFPSLADYVFMSSFSAANWDAPPGSGYPTVIAVGVVAISIMAVMLAPARRGIDEEDLSELRS